MKEVSKRKLKATYDAHAIAVLAGFVEPISNAWCKVLKPLPTQEEYEALKKEKFTAKVSDLIEEAYSEAEAVGEELREWHDNLSEGLQATEKAERIDEAANTLEGLDRPGELNILQHVTAYFVPTVKITSRNGRVSEAARQLETAADAIRAYAGNHNPKGKDQSTVKIDGENVKVNWTDLSDLADQIENGQQELEGVDIPGMYG